MIFSGMRSHVTIATLLLILLSLTGCSLRGGSDDLTGSEWQLQTLGGVAALDGIPVSMQLEEDDGLFGTGGCNRFTGTWSAGNGDELTLSPSAMTLIGCEQDVTDQEQAFIQALEATRSFERDGDVLTLQDANGAGLATLMKVEKASLTDTEWRLTYVNDGQDALVQAIAEAPVTATFNDDGTLNGNAGCNTFNSSYETDEDEITIEPAATTLMACDQPIMDQEFAFLHALEQASVHEIGTSSLSLRGPDGATLALFEATE